MAKRVSLTLKQRQLFAEKVMEWGNLVFVGLVIAQFVPGTTPFRFGLLIAGLLNFLGAYWIAFYVTKGGERTQ